MISPGGRTWRWLFLLLLALAGSGCLWAQQSPPSEYQVKAAFLYNFGKFVEWPDNDFPDADAPLIIGIYGDNPFGHDLEVMIKGKKISTHPVVVRQVPSLSGLKHCHIVFISMSKQSDAAAIVDALKDRNVLTVTENMKHFASSELVINLVTENNEIHFEINRRAARNAGLIISSKLLALAQKPER